MALDVNLLDGRFYAGDPYPTYRRLRDEAPVYRDEVNGVWGISRYHDIVDIEKNPVRYTSSEGSRPRIVGDVSSINNDDPLHQNKRRLVARRFTPRSVKQHEDQVRRIVTDLIDAVAGDGSCDAVRDLAAPPAGSPYDDDAALALLLAESLAEHGAFDAQDVANRWVEWMKRDGRGLGAVTRRALKLIERGIDPFEAGRQAREGTGAASATNGAVMRCIPVALRYHGNVDKLIRVSSQQAAVTHADPRCIWAAAAVNLAARELLRGNLHFLEEVLHRLRDLAPRALLDAMRRVAWEDEGALPIAVRGETGYVVHCVEIAFWSAVHHPSLEQALVFLAEAGGDTDTNAAVAGGLLGARDGVAGIPPRWLNQIVNADRIGDLAERLARMGD